MGQKFKDYKEKQAYYRWKTKHRGNMVWLSKMLHLSPQGMPYMVRGDGDTYVKPEPESNEVLR